MKYIRRNIDGIVLVNQSEKTIRSSLFHYLNVKCMNRGSTYQGRISSTKYKTNRKGLVPLYVNRNEIYLLSRNIRQWDVVLVNYCRVLSIRKVKTYGVLVVFDDLSELLLDVSYNRFKTQYDIAHTLKKGIL